MADVVVDFNGNGQNIYRITCKKNYASSMQSHKMGACRMFNLLHRLLAGKYPDLINEVDGNYAVEQYPILAFQDIQIEGTTDFFQRFIGHYTGGVDKGDLDYFKFTDPRVADTAIRMEGTDHIKGVGFNYPWEVNGVMNIRYNHDKEALCIVTGEDKTAWTAILEVSYCGNKETEEEYEAYLIEKFKPVFDLCENNNPLLVGTTMTIDEINADKATFQKLRRADGRQYSYCEFWIDGEYDIYYLNQERNQYEKNGLNVYDVLSAEEKALVDAATTLDEKNEIFIAHRVAAFKAEAETKICVVDAMLKLLFNFIIMATDNGEKNMYPYIMAMLLRFFEDDLDSIFKSDNQAQDTKKYSAELHDFTDKTQSAYVFKGEDNALFTLLEMAYPELFMQMGKDILQAMYDYAPKGTQTLDRLNAFYEEIFFDNAQNYFPITSYNKDAEYTYEEAWNDKNYVASVDIHPLAQSLGDHYATEKSFMNLRNIYLMSKFGFGGFASYEDNSLGIISVRTQDPVSFTLTPAIDMYPTILGGQAQISKATERILAGQSVTLPAVGGGNTNVYIVAADYLTDIGDLKDLSIDPSSVVALNISAKRLRWLKVGDADASAVTSYLGGLNIQQCDCLETIDARNLVSLQGNIDLSKCPRLYSALFANTSVISVNIPSGSKIEALSLPNTITTLSLVKLQKLTLENFNYEPLINLEYLWIDGNKHLSSIGLLLDIMTAQADQTDHSLKRIRVTGINESFDSGDVLTWLAKLTDGSYAGLDANGLASSDNPIPVLEGTITIDSNAYEDDIIALQNTFTKLKIIITGSYYVRFADPEVARVTAAKWGDGIGTKLEQIQAVDNVYGAYSGNDVIKTFDEFELFIGVKSIGDFYYFYQMDSIESLSLPPNIKSIGASSITYNPKLKFLKLPEGMINMANMSVCRNHMLYHIVIPSTVTSMNYNSNEGLFFHSNYNMAYAIIKPIVPPSINNNILYGAHRATLYVPDESIELYKTASNWIDQAARIAPMSNLPKVLIFPFIELIADKSVQMEAYLPNEKTDFNWSIVNGENFATIDNKGVLTFSDSDTPYSVTIRATLKSDDSIYSDVTYSRGVTFVHNKIMNVTETTKEGYSYAFLPLKPGTRVEYCDTSGGSLYQVESYTDLGVNRNNYHGGGTGVKNLSFGYIIRYMSISLLTSSIDYLYVKDAVSGIYLYKGNKVVE